MPDNNKNTVNNIAQVNMIEGLLSQVQGHLEAIKPENTGQQDAAFNALDSFKCLQSNELFELRKVFEWKI